MSKTTRLNDKSKPQQFYFEGPNCQQLGQGCWWLCQCLSAPPAAAIIAVRSGSFLPSYTRLINPSSLSACQTWIMRGQRTKVLGEQAPSLIARFDRYLMRGAYERSFSAHIRFLHAVVGRPRRSRILARMQKGTLDPQPYAGLRCNVESIWALALVSAIPADPPADGTQIRGGAQPLSSGMSHSLCYSHGKPRASRDNLESVIV